MTKDPRIPNLLAIVDQTKAQFEQLAVIHKAVNWPEEMAYAKRLLQENDYLAGIAAGNPDSLKYAILDAASTGISLNPSKHHASLVPRKVKGKMKVCFEPEWRGYVQQAVDIGAIKLCVPHLVYENDKFKYRSSSQAPEWEPDVFGDRGRLVGGFCETTLPDGTIMISHMALDAIHKIRDNTEGYKAYKREGKNTIWVSHYEQMCEKTLVRHARRNWPMNDNRASALNEVDEQNEPILLRPTPEPDDSEREQLMLDIRTMLDILKSSEEKYSVYLKRFHGRDVKKLEDLTKIELKSSLADLKQMVAAKSAKEKK